MKNLLKTALARSRAERLLPVEEIERFGSEGEEAACRMLRKNFDCVIRNVVVPHKALYLEKDFMVVYRGVPFILEIKNWKGEIGCEGDCFYQNKENGGRKKLKSPVGTTNQFIRCMKNFYKLECPVWGIVVFAEPNCKLSFPREMDGIALLPLSELTAFMRTQAKKEVNRGYEPIEPDKILRCTRFYSTDSEFCKGILADNYLECIAEDGARVRLDTVKLKYLTAEHQTLRLREKLYVTYANGTTGVFYSRDTVLTVACLDGSYRRIALNRIRHIVF